MEWLYGERLLQILLPQLNAAKLAVRIQYILGQLQMFHTHWLFI